MRKFLPVLQARLCVAVLIVFVPLCARAQDAAPAQSGSDAPAPSPSPAPSASPAQVTTVPASPAPSASPSPAATVAVQPAPTPPPGPEQPGITAMENGDFDAAIAAFAKLIQADDKNSKAYFLRATAYEAKGDMESAFADYNNAIKLNPDYAEAFYRRGAVYALGDTDNAIKDFSDAIRANPDYAPPYVFRGAIEVDNGDADKALADADKAISLDAANAGAYLVRGNANADLQNASKAAADYADAIRLDPKSAKSFVAYAWLLATNPDDTVRDGRKALEYAQKANELYHSKEPTCLRALAAAYAETGDFAQAVNYETQFDHTADLPSGEIVNCRRRMTLYQHGKPFHAADTDAYETKGVNESNPDLAIADFTKQIEADPGNALALFHRGHLLGDKGEADKAIADYTEALRVDPKLVEALINRGDTYRQKGDYDRALADLNAAIDIDATRAVPFIGRGYVYFALGDQQKAAVDFQEAVRLDASSFAACNALGSIAVANGDWKTASDWYRKAIDYNFRDVDAYTTRGSIRRAVGEMENSLADLNQAIFYGAGSKAYYERALLFHIHGEYGKAAADYAESIRLDPANANAVNNYCLLLATAPDDAVRDGRKAADIARKLCEQTNWKNGGDIDLLAAACAEAGDFDSALKYENLFLANGNFDAAGKASVQKRIALYRGHKPRREASYPFPVEAATRRIWLDGAINGRTIRLGYDTGSSATALFKSTADRLGLKIIPNPKDVPYYAIAPNRTDDIDLALGNNAVRESLNLIDVFSFLDAEADGLLSWNDFNAGDGKVLRIDAGKGSLETIDPPPDLAQWTKWNLASDSDILILEGKTGDGTVRIGVDTGDEAGVALNADRWKQFRAAHAAQPATVAGGWFPAQHMAITEILRSAELSLGEMTLKDVPVREMVPGQGGFSKCDAVIGLYALSGFEFIIDRKNGVAYTRPIAHPADQYSYNSIGAIFVPKDIDNPKDNDLVAYVMKGSPAERAGVRNGDIVVQSSFTDAKDWRSDTENSQVQSPDHKPGSKLTLQLKRGAKSLTITMVAEDLTPSGWKPVKDIPDFDKGMQAMAQEAYPAAIAWFNQSIYDNPTAAALFNRGIDFEKQDAPAEALEDYASAIKMNPKYWQAYARRAGIYSQRKEYDKAIADLDKVLQGNPRDGASLIARGRAYDGKKDRQNALKDFNQALKVAAKNANAWFYRGNIENDLDQDENAVRDFTEALRLDPTFNGAYYNRALAWKDLHQYQKAIADFSKFIELHPDDPDGWNHRGTTYDATGDHDKAISDLTEGIRLAPNDPDPYIDRGNAYDNKGDVDKALADYNESLRLNPNSSVANYDAGLIYNKKRDYPQAIQLFSRAISLYAKDADYFSHRA
ncbi:MAG TPA: tetratricopeptide repeat protein, partial [Chthoniobacteraceae bacterium]|nr:tetratricopeptide repeat protein [Chthoniobacteraceae bacterium]